MAMPTALSSLGTFLGNGLAGVLVVGGSVFVAPGLASADDPTVHGECAATVNGAEGTPLTVDAGAPAGSPGVIDIGLGHDSTRTDGEKPRVRLGLPDAINALGASEVPAVSPAATTICTAVADTANSVGATAQSALRAPEREPEPVPERQPPPTPQQPDDGAHGEEEINPPATDPGQPITDEPTVVDVIADDDARQVAHEAESVSEPLVVLAQPAAPVEIAPSELGFVPAERQPQLPRTPGLGSSPADKSEGEESQQTQEGQAHALPLAEKRTLSEVPLILAIALITGVTVVLVRRWRLPQANA